MLLHFFFLLLASNSIFSFPSLDVSLPEGCRDFTVGSCDAEEDELIDQYPEIPNGALCQTVCQIQEGCNYFRWSSSSLDCSLYHYRFLSSCNLIAGPKEPSIDDCAKEENPSCDSFVRENCLYKGAEVLVKDSITDAHACQDLLITVGWIYKAVYFSFDSIKQVCVLYDALNMDCDAISGPNHPDIEECGKSTTSVAPSTTTTTTTPAKTTPEKTTPAKTKPAKTTPVKTTPRKTTPAKTTPAKTTPEKTTPEETTPAKTTPE